MDPNALRVIIDAIQQQGTALVDATRQRNNIRDVIQRTTLCDGSRSTEVRTWIKDLDMAFQEVGQASIYQIIQATVRGSLRYEVVRFTTAAAAPHQGALHQVPWADIRAQVRVSFLHLNEVKAMRDELRDCRQESREGLISFSRRFRELAENAYPTADRNPDQHQIMLDAFYQGLRDRTILERLLENHAPADLPQALTGIQEIAQRQEQMDRIPRREEPMEVGAIQKDVAGQIADGFASAVNQLMGMVKPGPSNMTPPHPEVVNTPLPTAYSADMVAALASAMANQQERRTPPATSTSYRKGPSVRKMPRDPWQDGLPAFDQNGRPRCFHCKAYGHVRRDCHIRVNNRSSGNE